MNIGAAITVHALSEKQTKILAFEFCYFPGSLPGSLCAYHADTEMKGNHQKKKRIQPGIEFF